MMGSAGEPKPGVFGGAAWKKNREPEPLGKTSGAGAAKKLEDKNHKEILL